MATTDVRAAELGGAPLTETAVSHPVSYVNWSAIVAGALAAAALALVLHGFGVAVGLAVSSTAPTWRDASFALVALSGLYLVLVAIVAYGAGGYVVGRLRARLSAGPPDEIEFRDGVHGAAAWALATLLTALIAFGGAQALTRLAAPSSGPAGSSTSVAGENIIAYDLDRLFRGTRSDANIEYTRAEAARILLTASSHRGILPEDRTELIRLVSARTGLGSAGGRAARGRRDRAGEGKYFPRPQERRHPRLQHRRRSLARPRGRLVRGLRRRPPSRRDAALSAVGKAPALTRCAPSARVTKRMDWMLKNSHSARHFEGLWS